MNYHLETRSASSHTIVVNLGRDPVTGKRRRIHRSVKCDKKTAHRLAREMMREVDAGSYVEPTPVTVAGHLREWLDVYVRPNLAPLTQDTYRRVIEKHLIPALGAVQLQALTPVQIQTYYAHAEGLSARYLRLHHSVLREALKDAVTWRRLGWNPTDAVQAPRYRKREARALDAATVTALIEALPPREAAMGLLAAHTGMRLGEVLGLRWCDVDIQGRALSVAQAVQFVPAQGVILRPPKGGKARRLSVGEVAMGALAALRAQDPTEDQGALVFRRPDGGPWHPGSASHRFRDLAAGLGYPGVTFHTMRHSHASILMAQGVHPKVVQERLGHHSIEVTMDTYSHVLPGVGDEVPGYLDRLIRPGGQRKGDDSPPPKGLPPA